MRTIISLMNDFWLLVCTTWLYIVFDNIMVIDWEHFVIENIYAITLFLVLN
jgi:hypothetical protein